MNEDWPKPVKAAITHGKNINIHWRNHSKLTEWIDGNVDEAREALSEMWSERDRTPGDRIRAFDSRLPESVFSRGATSSRLDAASYFMMAIDTQSYPPYRPERIPKRVSDVGLSALPGRRRGG